MLHRENNMRTKWTCHASQHWVSRYNTFFMKNNWLRSQIPPLSTLTACFFVLIRITSLGACKFENPALFLRIGLPSTLIRLKFSCGPWTFSNGAYRKECSRNTHHMISLSEFSLNTNPKWTRECCVLLPLCGRKTFDAFLEWNLLFSSSAGVVRTQP